MRTLAYAAASLLPLLAASPAQGATPESFSFHDEEPGSIDCSQFNPSWQFRDDFVDFYDYTGTVFFDGAGNVTRVVRHVVHVSNDVNSVTGYTLHEHNHYTEIFDVVARTLTVNGAINIMQRPHTGSVILHVDHKVYSFDSDVPLAEHGPNMASDADFCAAIAPTASRR